MPHVYWNVNDVCRVTIRIDLYVCRPKLWPWLSRHSNMTRWHYYLFTCHFSFILDVLLTHFPVFEDDYHATDHCLGNAFILHIIHTPIILWAPSLSLATACQISFVPSSPASTWSPVDDARVQYKQTTISWIRQSYVLVIDWASSITFNCINYIILLYYFTDLTKSMDSWGYTFLESHFKRHVTLYFSGRSLMHQSCSLQISKARV